MGFRRHLTALLGGLLLVSEQALSYPMQFESPHPFNTTSASNSTSECDSDCLRELLPLMARQGAASGILKTLNAYNAVEWFQSRPNSTTVIEKRIDIIADNIVKVLPRNIYTQCDDLCVLQAGMNATNFAMATSITWLSNMIARSSLMKNTTDVPDSVAKLQWLRWRLSMEYNNFTFDDQQLTASGHHQSVYSRSYFTIRHDLDKRGAKGLLSSLISHWHRVLDHVVAKSTRAYLRIFGHDDAAEKARTTRKWETERRETEDLKKWWTNHPNDVFVKVFEAEQDPTFDHIAENNPELKEETVVKLDPEYQLMHNPFSELNKYVDLAPKYSANGKPRPKPNWITYQIKALEGHDSELLGLNTEHKLAIKATDRAAADAEGKKFAVKPVVDERGRQYLVVTGPPEIPPGSEAAPITPGSNADPSGPTRPEPNADPNRPTTPEPNADLNRPTTPESNADPNRPTTPESNADSGSLATLESDSRSGSEHSQRIGVTESEGDSPETKAFKENARVWKAAEAEYYAEDLVDILGDDHADLRTDIVDISKGHADKYWMTADSTPREDMEAQRNRQSQNHEEPPPPAEPGQKGRGKSDPVEPQTPEQQREQPPKEPSDPNDRSRGGPDGGSGKNKGPLLPPNTPPQDPNAHPAFVPDPDRQVDTHQMASDPSVPGTPSTHEPGSLHGDPISHMPEPQPVDPGTHMPEPQPADPRPFEFRPPRPP